VLFQPFAEDLCLTDVGVRSVRPRISAVRRPFPSPLGRNSLIVADVMVALPVKRRPAVIGAVHVSRPGRQRSGRAPGSSNSTPAAGQGSSPCESRRGHTGTEVDSCGPRGRERRARPPGARVTEYPLRVRTSWPADESTIPAFRNQLGVSSSSRSSALADHAGVSGVFGRRPGHRRSAERSGWDAAGGRRRSGPRALTAALRSRRRGRPHPSRRPRPRRA